MFSTAIRPSRTANQTLHTSCNLRAAQGTLDSSRAATGGPGLIAGTASIAQGLYSLGKPPVSSSEMQVDPTRLLEQTLTQNEVSFAVGQTSDSVTWKKSTEPCTFFFFIAFQSREMLSGGVNYTARLAEEI